MSHQEDIAEINAIITRILEIKEKVEDIERRINKKEQEYAR
jgi:hypothetical protein